jgi:hypothetical protein
MACLTNKTIKMLYNKLQVKKKNLKKHKIQNVCLRQINISLIIII